MSDTDAMSTVEADPLNNYAAEHAAEQPAEQAADTNKPPGTKRRAQTACVICRNRKVRCDVVEKRALGLSCTNCVYDKVVCEVQESRRRRKKLAARAPTPQQMHHPQGPGVLPPGQYPLPAFQAQIMPAPHAPGLAGLGSLFENTPITMPAPHAPGLAGLGPLFENTSVAMAVWKGHQSQAARKLVLDSLPRQSLIEPLPMFIQDLTPKMDAVDVVYLQAKGVFRIPNEKVRAAFLSAYVDYFHATMPVVDLHELLNAIDRPGPGMGKISLLLFQSMMFAASAFVDEDTLFESGFSDRLDARRTLYARCKKLLDCDYEWNRISVIQSVLLLSTFYDVDRSLKDVWHYMQLGKSHAEAIGLNFAPKNLSVRDQKVWRNVYWGLYLRDRMLAVGLRRAPRVQDMESPPMLEPSDFLGWALPEDSRILAPNCLSASDMKVQETQYLLYIKQCELAVHIDRILKVQYSKCATNTTPPIEGDVIEDPRGNILMPDMSPSNQVSVNELYHVMVSWYGSLSEVGAADQPLSAHDPHRDLLGIQRHGLGIAYFAAVSVLLRPETLAAKPADVRVEAAHKLKYAARSIMRLFRELDQFQLTGCLTSTSVTFLMQSVMTNLQDIKGTAFQETRGTVMMDIKKVERDTLKDFIDGVELMNKIARLYPAASNGVMLILRGIRGVGNYEVLKQEHVAREAAVASAAASTWHEVDTPPAEKADGQQFGAFANSAQPTIFTPTPANEPTWDSPPHTPEEHGLPILTYPPVVPQNPPQGPFSQSQVDSFSSYASPTDPQLYTASEMMDEYIDFPEDNPDSNGLHGF